ncbi:MAG: DUF2061 domain-containing protein [Pseudomonadota bacterium]
MDTRARTWVKALLWNAIGLAVMSVVGFFMTGSAAIGGTMAVINTGVGLACYVVYERIWSRVRWGRVCG